jgi:HlyD family secretion protein
MKRFLIVCLVLAVVIGGSWFGYQRFAQAKEPEAPDWETVVVTRGTIISTVSATGNIEPASRVLLSFKSPGRVADVLAQEGQEVKAGDLLARLEAAELELALAQAETGVTISQAQLSRLENSRPSASDVAAAEAALASAQAAYQELLAGPGKDELDAARGTVERALLVRDQAQAAYDQVAHLPNVGMLPQSLQLQQATLDYSLAETNYRLAVKGPSEAQKSAARAQVAQAQASLDRLQQDPAAEDVQIARAQVDQAGVGVEQARLALAGTELRSPFDGVISALNVQAGELTSGALPAVELADLSGFHITVNVDEIDVGAVAVGQEASITLDALADLELAGHVSSIAPTASLETGVISYRLRIDIDPSDAPLRSGMSATARIIAAQATDVLVLPNRLIRLDRSNGKAYVDRLEGGVPVRVEIIMGMRNEQQSEIVSGLQEGDEVVLQQASSLDQLRQTFGPQ